MSRLTDLLEEHTAEAVWSAMQDMAAKIDELAKIASESTYAKFHTEFRQGVDHMRQMVWEAIDHYDPNPTLNDEE